MTTSDINSANRRLPWILLILAVLLCLSRFLFLRADFPNHSPWLLDSAKFTDEGWWANAAVRHTLLGHWRIAGDYNPAVVVPVWPALLAILFHFTGVSLVATRALNVAFSLATVFLLYLVARRWGSTRLTASLAALLLASSSFAFVFSRLATLDTLMVLEWMLCVLLASWVGLRKRWPALALCLLMLVIVLTKTTGLVLLPAVLWLLWKKSWRALLAVAVVAGAAVAFYPWLVLHSRYAEDYRYFFTINAMEDVDWKQTADFLSQLFENGLWVDPVLYPVTLAALVLALAWLRSLWKNPLFVACWIAIAAQCVFILRRQDDYAPRYFLVMLIPMILIPVLTLEELARRNRWLAGFTAAVLAAAVGLNAWQTFGFLNHREYQFYSAAKSIAATIDSDPSAPRLLLGTSADQLALMARIPSINDSYTSEDLGKKAEIYKPGWYLGWNDLDEDILGSLSNWRLTEVANYPVFDRDERNRLKLYRMVPLKETPQ